MPASTSACTRRELPRRQKVETKKRPQKPGKIEAQRSKPECPITQTQNGPTHGRMRQTRERAARASQYQKPECEKGLKTTIKSKILKPTSKSEANWERVKRRTKETREGTRCFQMKPKTVRRRCTVDRATRSMSGSRRSSQDANRSASNPSRIEAL